MRPTRALSVLPALALALLLGACQGHGSSFSWGSPWSSNRGSGRDGRGTGVSALVLGTAQDAGLPQIGCEEPCCRAVWEDPELRRMPSSLLVSDERSGKRWLFDATPELVRQIELARGTPASRPLGPVPPGGSRPPLFDGVFLTHTHMGHYAGLLHLGTEAYGARGVPVYATYRVSAFLNANEPWATMVRDGVLHVRPLNPDVPVHLAPGLSATPILVPHRDEYSDTVAFRIDGPARSLLYLPDIDKWSRWDRSIEDLIATVEVALLDGTFYADGEIPGRSMEDIPHPFVSESIERFAPLPAWERAKIRFTHLNHTNPLALPDGEAQRAVRDAGMAVAHDGQAFGL